MTQMLLDLPAIGFLTVLLATAFLFGELLVKGRGILGLVGLGLIAVYFSYYVTPQSLFYLSVLYLVGLMLIIVDVKLTNHGFIALIGIVLMMIALAIPAPSLLFGILVALAFLVGLGLSFVFLKVFPARQLWSKLTLTDQLTGDLGYNSINEGYQGLVGKEGVTATPFRPIGTVEIEEKPYSAITEGKWLKAEVRVVVSSVDGTRIVIKEQKEQEKAR